MVRQNAGFDFDRYRKLLAEATDEPRRLALIDILVEERARDHLAAHRAADRNAATASAIARAVAASRFSAS